MRVTVEWGFAQLKQFSKLINNKNTMKLQESRVDYHVKCAALMMNAHTMLCGNPSSRYYKIGAPLLADYFMDCE
jgi:hypothetical protein